MAAPAFSRSSTSYKAAHFSLAWQTQNNTVNLVYKSDGAHLMTQTLPNTVWLLTHNLPSITHHKCINDENLAFIDEAANTEIAHLFEHILIENICRGYAAIGDRTVVAKGVTRWHAARFLEGEFFIEIAVNKLDEAIFFTALERSISLMEKVLESGGLETTLQTVPMALLASA